MRWPPDMRTESPKTCVRNPAGPTPFIVHRLLSYVFRPRPYADTGAFILRNCLNPKLRATELRNYKLVKSPIVFVKLLYVVMASALIPISQRFMGSNFGRNTCAFNIRNCLNRKLRATELRNYKRGNSPIVF